MNIKISLLSLILSVLMINLVISQQTEQNMTIELNYLIYLPGDYDSSEEAKWPLILFLHGAGERGNNLELVKRHGPPKLVEDGKEFRFIIVSPQCPAGQWWSADLLNRLLDKITSEYRIDKDRIYLTGLSMGGFGTWDLVSEYPEWFAAIAPICGGSHPELAWNMRHIPAWVFHGAKDEVVPVGLSEIMVKALKKYNPEVMLTIYPEAQHDSWTETYNNPELYEWFLKHKKYKPESVSTNEMLYGSLAGEYQFINSDRKIIITSTGTKLYAEEIKGVRIALIPESAYAYHFRNSKGGITFRLDKKGSVTGLLYHLNGEIPAKKLK